MPRISKIHSTAFAGMVLNTYTYYTEQYTCTIQNTFTEHLYRRPAPYTCTEHQHTTQNNSTQHTHTHLPVQVRPRVLLGLYPALPGPVWRQLQEVPHLWPADRQVYICISVYISDQQIARQDLKSVMVLPQPALCTGDTVEMRLMKRDRWRNRIETFM